MPRKPFSSARVAASWALAAACLSAHGDETAAQLGERLYDGRQPLAGRLRGHDQDLPAQVLRCTNCHEPSRTLAQGSVAYAPRLDRASLMASVSRRGGPPSRYEEAQFCALLRTSVDPTNIMVNRAMPQYAATDAQCAALWSYVSQR